MPPAPPGVGLLVCGVHPCFASDRVRAGHAHVSPCVTPASASQLAPRPRSAPALFPTLVPEIPFSARETWSCHSTPSPLPGKHFLPRPATWWILPCPSDLSLPVNSTEMPSVTPFTHPSCPSSFLCGCLSLPTGYKLQEDSLCLVHHCVPSA